MQGFMVRKSKKLSVLMILTLLIQVTSISSWVWAAEGDGAGTGNLSQTTEATPTEPSAVAVTGISLNRSHVQLAIDGSERLEASIQPSNATNQQVAWSTSDPNVLRVETDGTLVPVAPGIAAITVLALDGKYSAACIVEVFAPVRATGITLNKVSTAISVNNWETLVATVRPDNADNKEVEWSSDNPQVAEVDQGGRVTAKAGGTAVITVRTKDGGFTATCTVNVTTTLVRVTGISLDKTSLTINKGTTAILSPNVKPSNASNKGVTWSSSNSAVAAVDEQTGVITGVSKGIATIYATTHDGNKRASCKVTVKVPVTGVAWQTSMLTLPKGKTATVYATVYPLDANSKSVTYQSSNTAVATVSSGGISGTNVKATVRGIAYGTANITVTTVDGAKTAQFTVKVTEPVTKVQLTPTSITVNKGRDVTVISAVYPANATNKNLIWSSSNEAIATVVNGKVTGRQAGTATIYAKSAENSAKYSKCTVTVVVPVSGVALDVPANTTVTNIILGTSHKLTATVSPSDATNKTVKWTSSNTAIATVDSTGKVTAKKIGYCTITAEAYGVRAYRTISVIPKPVSVTSISINTTKLSLPIARTQYLMATISPANATTRDITWRSSNTAVAEVVYYPYTSMNATVRTKAPGTATITATTKDGGKQATCVVTVYAGPNVESLAFGTPTVSVAPGGAVRLIPVVTPVNAVRTYTWTSSRTDIATVDYNGIVRGLKAGTSVITVKEQNGKTATCNVEVTTAPVNPVNGSGVTVPLPISMVNSVVNGKNAAIAYIDESRALTDISQRPAVSSVTIPVPGNHQVVVTKVYYGLLSNLISKNANIELRSDNGSYILPAKEINIPAVAGQLGAPYHQAKINMVIERPDSNQINQIRNAVMSKGFTLIGNPLDFRIEGYYGNNTVEVNQFHGYVERSIALTGAVDVSASVGVRVNDDGTFSPVPTRFASENGKTVAYLKSRGNSMYAVVQAKKSFADTNGHWAKDDINTLASRMIISGVRNNQYAPDNKVTRAEFATIVVRALGMELNPEKANFVDVKSSDWYAGAIGTAVEAGIIKGYEDNSFRPNAYVTREEVAIMLVRAMRLTGRDISLGTQGADAYLTKFADQGRINSWAKESVAVATKLNIVTGNKTGMFLPGNNTTRAETAVTVKRMLIKVKFM